MPQRCFYSGYTIGILYGTEAPDSTHYGDITEDTHTGTRHCQPDVAHVEKFIFDRGFAAERPLHDYGFDLCMTTFAPDGGAEPGNVWFQLKATDTVPMMQDGRTISFPLRWEDIALWREEPCR